MNDLLTLDYALDALTRQPTLGDFMATYDGICCANEDSMVASEVLTLLPGSDVLTRVYRAFAVDFPTMHAFEICSSLDLEPLLIMLHHRSAHVTPKQWGAEMLRQAGRVELDTIRRINNV